MCSSQPSTVNGMKISHKMTCQGITGNVNNIDVLENRLDYISVQFYSLENLIEHVLKFTSTHLMMTGARSFSVIHCAKTCFHSFTVVARRFHFRFTEKETIVTI